MIQSFTANGRILTAATGSQGGVSLTPYLGQVLGSALRVIGALPRVSPTTGVAYGTAGSGTTSTTVNKPTGAANWTAGDLAGKYVRILGGGGSSSNGAPVLSPILGNTTTTLAISAITGLDSTSVFEVVSLASQLDRISSTDLNGLRAEGFYGPLEIYGVDFSTAHGLDSLISLTDCLNVKVSGCNLSINTASPALNIVRCNKVVVENCQLTNSSDISITGGSQSVTVRGCVSTAGGQVLVQDATVASVTGLDCASNPSRALAMIRVLTAEAEVTCYSAGATPVYLEDILRFSVVGTGLTGNGNAGYGVEIANSGRYNVVGCTLSGGTGDVLFMGTATTWALLSGGSYGIISEHAGSAFANASYNMALHYGNEIHLGSQFFSSRVLFYGFTNLPQLTGITATGSTQADAFDLAQGFYFRFDTVAAGTGCRLFLPAATALPGVELVIKNAGANGLKVYPPVGGTLDGGATNAPITVAAGTKKRFICVSANAYDWESF